MYRSVAFSARVQSQNAAGRVELGDCRPPYTTYFQAVRRTTPALVGWLGGWVAGCWAPHSLTPGWSLLVANCQRSGAKDMGLREEM